MSALMDDTVGITVVQLADDYQGRPIFQWSVTLGDGTRRGFEQDREAAMERARVAKRYLLAVESHDPDTLERIAHTEAATPTRVELIGSWGGTVMVNAADVEQALANGCRFPGDVEPEHAAEESKAERARRQRPRVATQEPDPDA
jgi:hypothetical protein